MDDSLETNKQNSVESMNSTNPKDTEPANGTSNNQENEDSDIELLEEDDEEIEEITVIELSDTEIRDDEEEEEESDDDEEEKEIIIKEEPVSDDGAEGGETCVDFDASQLGVIITQTELPADLMDEPVNGVYKCRFCLQKFPGKLRLIAHIERHISNGTIRKCRFCEFYTVNTQKLFEHECIHTKEKPFQCSKCTFCTRAKGDLYKHERIHSSEKRFQCNECGHQTRTAPNLRRHMEKHIVDMPRNFVCKICGDAFKRKSALQMHLKRRHNDNKPIMCDQCSFRCKSLWELKNHKAKHSNDYAFYCTWPGCDKRYKTKSDCNKHIKRHNGIKKYECQICKKAFFTSTVLRKHIESHSDQRNYECGQCMKRFKTFRTLQSHVGTHQTVKRFLCEICYKTYSTQSNLEMHKRVHEGGRPYQCPICLHGSREMDHLMAHVGSEHLHNFIYVCSLCRKPFGKSFSLQLHFQRCHKEELEGKEESLVYEPEYLDKDFKSEANGTFEPNTFVKCLARETMMDLGTLHPSLGTLHPALAALTTKQEAHSKNSGDDSEMSSQSSSLPALPDDLQLPPVVQIGRYAGIPFCMSRKNSGLQLNCLKKGKKPKGWFMDVSQMTESAAENHNEYLMKKKLGLLPWTNKPRRKPKKVNTTKRVRKTNTNHKSLTSGKLKRKQKSRKRSWTDEEETDEDEAYLFEQQLMLANQNGTKSEPERSSSRPRKPAVHFKNLLPDDNKKKTAISRKKVEKANLPEEDLTQPSTSGYVKGKVAIRKQNKYIPKRNFNKKSGKGVKKLPTQKSNLLKQSSKKIKTGIRSSLEKSVKKERSKQDNHWFSVLSSPLALSHYKAEETAMNTECWLKALRSDTAMGHFSVSASPCKRSISIDQEVTPGNLREMFFSECLMLQKCAPGHKVNELLNQPASNANGAMLGETGGASLAGMGLTEHIVPEVENCLKDIVGIVSGEWSSAEMQDTTQLSPSQEHHLDPNIRQTTTTCMLTNDEVKADQSDNHSPRDTSDKMGDSDNTSFPSSLTCNGKPAFTEHSHSSLDLTDQNSSQHFQDTQAKNSSITKTDIADNFDQLNVEDQNKINHEKGNDDTPQGKDGHLETGICDMEEERLCTTSGKTIDSSVTVQSLENGSTVTLDRGDVKQKLHSETDNTQSENNVCAGDTVPNSVGLSESEKESPNNTIEQEEINDHATSQNMEQGETNDLATSQNMEQEEINDLATSQNMEQGETNDLATSQNMEQGETNDLATSQNMEQEEINDHATSQNMEQEEINDHAISQNMEQEEINDHAISQNLAFEKSDTELNTPCRKCLHVLVPDIRITPCSSALLQSFGVSKVSLNTHSIKMPKFGKKPDPTSSKLKTSSKNKKQTNKKQTLSVLKFKTCSRKNNLENLKGKLGKKDKAVKGKKVMPKDKPMMKKKGADKNVCTSLSPLSAGRKTTTTGISGFLLATATTAKPGRSPLKKQPKLQPKAAKKTPCKKVLPKQEKMSSKGNTVTGKAKKLPGKQASQKISKKEVTKSKSVKRVSQNGATKKTGTNKKQSQTKTQFEYSMKDVGEQPQELWSSFNGYGTIKMEPQDENTGLNETACTLAQDIPMTEVSVSGQGHELGIDNKVVVVMEPSSVIDTNGDVSCVTESASTEGNLMLSGQDSSIPGTVSSIIENNQLDSATSTETSSKTKICKQSPKLEPKKRGRPPKLESKKCGQSSKLEPKKRGRPPKQQTQPILQNKTSKSKNTLQTNRKPFSRENVANKINHLETTAHQKILSGVANPMGKKSNNNKVPTMTKSRKRNKSPSSQMNENPVCKKKKKYMYVETDTGELPDPVPKKRGRKPGPKVVLDRSQVSVCLEQTQLLDQQCMDVCVSSEVEVFSRGVYNEHELQYSQHPLFGPLLNAESDAVCTEPDQAQTEDGVLSELTAFQLNSELEDVKPLLSDLNEYVVPVESSQIDELGMLNESKSSVSLPQPQVPAVSSDCPLPHTGTDEGDDARIALLQVLTDHLNTSDGNSLEEQQSTQPSLGHRAKPGVGTTGKRHKKKCKDRTFNAQNIPKPDSERRRSDRRKRLRLTEEELRKVAVQDSGDSDLNEDERDMVYSLSYPLVKNVVGADNDLEFVSADYSHVDLDSQRVSLADLSADGPADTEHDKFTEETCSNNTLGIRGNSTINHEEKESSTYVQVDENPNMNIGTTKKTNTEPFQANTKSRVIVKQMPDSKIKFLVKVEKMENVASTQKCTCSHHEHTSHSDCNSSNCVQQSAVKKEQIKTDSSHSENVTSVFPAKGSNISSRQLSAHLPNTSVAVPLGLEPYQLPAPQPSTSFAVPLGLESSQLSATQPSTSVAVPLGLETSQLTAPSPTISVRTSEGHIILSEEFSNV